MTVLELLDTVSFVLNDVGHVAYPEPDLLAAVNHGCRMVSVVRPDSSAVDEAVTLAEGIKQTLPPGRLRLLEPLYQLDDGDQVQWPVELVLKSELDRLDPDWVQQPPSDQVTELMYDERFPYDFWVNPPSQAGVRLLLSMSVVPAPVTSTADDFPLSDKYIPPVMEWVWYLMFSRDSERSANQHRATDHRNQFYQMLQVKIQSDARVSPARPGSEG